MAGASKPLTVDTKQQRIARPGVADLVPSRGVLMTCGAVCPRGHVGICGSPRGAIPWGHPALPLFPSRCVSDAVAFIEQGRARGPAAKVVG